MRNFWAHTKQPGSHKAAGLGARGASGDYDSAASRTSPTWPASSTTPHQQPIPNPSPPHRVAGQPASPARARPSLVYHAASAADTRPEPAPGSGFNRSVPKP